MFKILNDIKEDIKCNNYMIRFKKYVKDYLIYDLLISDLFILIVILVYVAIFRQNNIFIGVAGSLIVGAVSAIGIIFNLKDNKKSKKLLLKQNFIQLRFHDSKGAIFDLMEYIQISLVVYKELVDIQKYKIIQFLDPRSFLIIQFINIISNINLLKNLPIKFRNDIEWKFKDKLDNISYQKEMPNLNAIFDIVLKKPIPIFIGHMNQYCRFLDEFKNQNDYENKLGYFKIYYCSNISEEEFYNHFSNILNIIGRNSIESLILEDMDLIYTHKNFDQFSDRIFD